MNNLQHVLFSTALLTCCKLQPVVSFMESIHLVFGLPLLLLPFTFPSIIVCSRAVVPNLGPPDVLGLQLPEILASRGGGEDFWEL